MIDVRNFGARGDGVTLDTIAIQKALNVCDLAGGGEVYFPAGRYLTGTLVIPSNTTVNISSGATLLGSPSINDYIREPEGRDGDQTGYHLLRIRRAHHVRVVGGGTIDGQGAAFWDTPENPIDGKFPWRGYYLAKSAMDERPSPMVDIYASKDVRIEDVTLTQSAGWALNMALSRWVWVRGVKILNPMNGPNTDGIDIQGCQDVIISDCHIENGDDSIVMFTLPHSGPCERIAVNNCIISTRCVAVKFYTGNRYPFCQVTVNNVVVYNSERAFGVYLSNGAQLEDIVCSNFVVHGGSTPPNFSERLIHIDIRDPYAYWKNRETYLRDPHVMISEVENEPTPEDVRRLAEEGSISGLTFSNWTLRSKGRIIVGGQEQAPVRNLIMENIQMFVTGNQDLSRFVQPTPSTGQWNHDLPHLRTVPAHVILHGVHGGILSNLNIVNASKEPLAEMHGFWLEKSKDIQMDRFRCYPLRPGMDIVHQAEATE